MRYISFKMTIIVVLISLGHTIFGKIYK